MSTSAFVCADANYWLFLLPYSSFILPSSALSHWFLPVSPYTDLCFMWISTRLWLVFTLDEGCVWRILSASNRTNELSNFQSPCSRYQTFSPTGDSPSLISNRLRNKSRIAIVTTSSTGSLPSSLTVTTQWPSRCSTESIVPVDQRSISCVGFRAWMRSCFMRNTHSCRRNSASRIYTPTFLTIIGAAFSSSLSNEAGVSCVRMPAPTIWLWTTSTSSGSWALSTESRRCRRRRSSPLW